MIDNILIKRGLKENLPVLLTGELAFTTDTKEFFIGTEDGNVLLNPQIEKVLVAEWRYNGGIHPATMPFGPLGLGLSANFVRNFDADELGDIVWFDFSDSNTNTLIYNDLRFNSMEEVIEFIKDNLTEVINTGGIIVRAYIKHLKNVSLSITAFNGEYSRLRGGKHLNDNRRLMTNIFHEYQDWESPKLLILKGFLRKLYQTTQNKTLNDNELTDALHTITTSGSHRLRGQLPRNKNEGDIFGKIEETQNDRKVYNTVTGTWEYIRDVFPDPNTKLRFGKCFFYATSTPWNHTSSEIIEPDQFKVWHFYQYDSYVKVYEIYADNSLGQRCVYYRLYTVGIDSFSIRSFNEWTKNAEYSVYMKYKDSRTFPTLTKINTLAESNNRFIARISGLDYKHKFPRNSIDGAPVKSSNKDFHFFVGEKNTGLCTMYSPDLQLRFDARGTQFRIDFK